MESGAKIISYKDVSMTFNMKAKNVDYWLDYNDMFPPLPSRIHFVQNSLSVENMR